MYKRLKEMDMRLLEARDRTLTHHLSQIQEHLRENSEVKDDRPRVLPPILPPPQTQRRETPDPATLALYEQQRKREDGKLLDELARIEYDLRDGLRRDVERQRALDTIRMEENRISWSSLCYLTLNQRVRKAFSASYYKNIPMHIYCLPIQSVAHKPNKKKKKKERKK